MTQKFDSVPLVDMNTLPKDVKTLLEQLPPLNVFRTIANLPTSIGPFIALARSFFKDANVDLRLLEIGILRVGHLNKCKYEWHQHQNISKAIGISEEEIDFIRTEAVVTSLSFEENFICQISDELTKNSDLSNETFDELFKKYSIQQGVAIILCMSFYNMLAKFLNATRVQIEDDNPLAGKSSPIN